MVGEYGEGKWQLIAWKWNKILETKEEKFVRQRAVDENEWGGVTEMDRDEK